MTEKRVDGARELARVSGLNRSDVLAIWEEVKANTQKLEACPGPHEFTQDDDPSREVFKRWRCAKCGGVVNVEGKLWYERGLAHGRTHG